MPRTAKSKDAADQDGDEAGPEIMVFHIPQGGIHLWLWDAFHGEGGGSGVMEQWSDGVVEGAEFQYSNTPTLRCPTAFELAEADGNRTHLGLC